MARITHQLLLPVVLGGVEPRAPVQIQVDPDVLALQVLQRATQGRAQRGLAPVLGIAQPGQLLGFELHPKR